MLKKLLAGIGAAGLLMFGSATAAQAAYVSPEVLLEQPDSNWFAGTHTDGEIEDAPGFSQCAIIFPETGGYVGYYFSEADRPTGEAGVTGVLNGFSASLSQGAGTLEVLIDRDMTGGGGISDIYLSIPVGVHGMGLDTVVELDDDPSLGLPDGSTVQDVIDALVDAGDVFYIIELSFLTDEPAEVQWLAFGTETHWFGTDAEWFVNDPSCGTAVPEKKPTPPAKIETAA